MDGFEPVVDTITHWEVSIDCSGLARSFLEYPHITWQFGTSESGRRSASPLSSNTVSHSRVVAVPCVSALFSTLPWTKLS